MEKYRCTDDTDLPLAGNLLPPQQHHATHRQCHTCGARSLSWFARRQSDIYKREVDASTIFASKLRIQDTTIDAVSVYGQTRSS